MRRREFTSLLCSAAVSWPLATRAQQSPLPVVGFLNGASPVPFAFFVAAFRGGLQEMGYVEGRNVAIEYRWAEGQNDRLPTLAADLVQLKDLQEAARAVGQQIHVLYAGSGRGLDTAFASLTQLRAGALLICSDVFFNSIRDHIVALAARYAIPAIYEWREFAAAGGLMSYGTNLAEGYRQVGVYTGRILKGEKPADLPVVQSIKFEFVINLKTAQTLGLDVPPGLVAQADEVIE